MQIGQAIFEALETNEATLFCIVADWIEDNKQGHPEQEVYLRRLRAPGVRIRTIIDVVCKFGNRGERKLYSRINRILLEMRHLGDRPLPAITDVFSLENRRRINRYLKVAAYHRTRKKPILASVRSRTVLNNEYWFVKALRSLLAKHYPATDKMVGGDEHPASKSAEAP